MNLFILPNRLFSSLGTQNALLLHFFLISVFTTLFFSCANVVAPTGGPIDEAPPKVIRSVPENLSTHYGGEDVRIFFNEFIEIKNLQQQFLVSPPLENMPEITVRGRSIIMEVSDTLQENTTYNFFFGESIVDFTEGNPIPNFSFVVSTGSYVDSLSVRGFVRNAFNLAPEAGVYVMLYDRIFDSVPMLEKPIYLSKTNKEGEFVINHMRDGEYLMFALRDSNFNFLYDNIEEEIAFLDSLVRPEYYLPPVPVEATDSLENKKDSLDLGKDETPIDLSEKKDQEIVKETDDDEMPVHPYSDVHVYDLFLFQQEDTLQRIESRSFTQKGRLEFYFRIPTQEVSITRLDTLDEGESWHIPEFNASRDTLTLWFANYAADSLFFEIRDADRLTDTIRKSSTPRERGRGRARASEPQDPVLTINAQNIRGGVLPFFKNLEFKSATPLQEIDFSTFQLYEHDSIPIQMQWQIKDEAQRTFGLIETFEQNTPYSLLIPDSTISDIFGAANDTIVVKFKTNQRENYGNLLINITLPKENTYYILQLLSDKEVVIQEKFISSSSRYTFENLRAEKFKLRLIHDANNNRVWDTGHYLQKTQPERVYMYPEPIESRANWDVEVIWDVLVFDEVNQ